MFCRKCGVKLADGAAFCNHCGTPVTRQQNDTRSYQNQMDGYYGQSNHSTNYRQSGISGSNETSKGGHVTTIFHSMMHQKDKGTIWELALWIIVCVASLIALLAGILVDGEMSYLGGIQICWILLFFSAIGYGVLLLLQLRVWSVLYGITVYPLLFLIFYYLCENKLTYLFLGSDKPVGPILLFIMAFLTAIGLVVCVMIHTFSQQYHLQKVIMILSIVTMELVFLLSIGSYAFTKHSYKSQRQEHWENYYKNYDDDYDEDTYSSDRTMRKQVDKQLDNEMDDFNTVYKGASNGMGSIAYVLLCLISGMYAIVFYCGMLDNQKQKILFASMAENVSERETAGGMTQMDMPVLEYLQGSFAGKSMVLQGEIIIGSDPNIAQIAVPDELISRQHCRIRFDVQRGCFEVCDLSRNGVFLQGGARLQTGMYVACARGTILFLASNRQVIRLH